MGTLFLAAWLTFFGILGFSCFNFSKPIINTGSAIGQARAKIQDYVNTHNGTLPDDADGNVLIAPYPDGWGHTLRYRARGLSYEITSAGPDGIFDTQDDMNTQ